MMLKMKDEMNVLNSGQKKNAEKYSKILSWQLGKKIV